MSTKKKETLELVKKEETSLATSDALQGDWSFEGDPDDILIPKLLLGQFTSEAVQDERVKFGDIYKSTTGEVLGNSSKAVEFIPLFMFKTWVISEKVGGRYEFRKIEPFTLSNKDLMWEFTVNGVEWKREKALNCYCLLPQDISKDLKARKALVESGEFPDANDSLLPCLLQFKSTSYNEGKKITSHFAQASDFNVPPYLAKFSLTSEKVTNDRGTFFKFNTSRNGKSDPATWDACKKWFSIVRGNKVKVDNSDLEETAPTMEAPDYDVGSDKF